MHDRSFYGEHATTRGAWHRTLASIAATGACAVLAACQSPGIVGARATQGTITGRVAADTDSASIVVVAIDRSNGRIAQRAFLPKPGKFSMPMTAGRYKLYAFADLDGNGARGGSEPASVVYSLVNEVRAGDRFELPAMELPR